MEQEASAPKVGEIGEQGLLRRLQSFCPPEFVGDDAAVLIPQPGRSLIVTSDLLVDGVHFSDRTTTPEDAGWRAAAVNLSDLAAMGASPSGITVGLSLPGHVTVEWVERLYGGLTECLQQYNTPIVGGDVCRSPVITVAITAFGQADPNQIIRRSTAQQGDAIVVTGPHGASRGGLELLLNPESRANLSSVDQTALIQAHQRPKPRLDVVPVLKAIFDSQFLNLELTPQNSKGSRYVAGMDSSDGLADAIVQICRASGVGARVDRNKIPIPSGLLSWVGSAQAMDWALYGGEDFELVLCLPSQKAQELVQQLGPGAAIVGRVITDRQVWLVDETGNFPDQQLTLEKGFQHFSS
jgi:thiamine-monophosphate kinase